MTTVIFIYLIETMENIAKPVATSAEDFKENPTMFYPDWDSETMKYSTVLLQNPVIDSETGELREMTEFEKVKAGKRTLDDGSYLDETSKTIVTISKPNEYSVWDKDGNIWTEDKTLKKSYLEKKRYEQQQKYISLKSKKEKLEEEKTEFEDLGFDTSVTEENIKNTDEEMKKVLTEVKAITKELKTL